MSDLGRGVLDHVGGQMLKEAVASSGRFYAAPAVRSKEPPQKKKVSFNTGVFRMVPMQKASAKLSKLIVEYCL